MHGQEIEFGGNPVTAEAIVRKHNEEAARLRAAQEAAEEARRMQVVNMTGNAALTLVKYPGFARQS